MVAPACYETNEWLKKSPWWKSDHVTWHIKCQQIRRKLDSMGWYPVTCNWSLIFNGGVKTAWRPSHQNPLGGLKREASISWWSKDELWGSNLGSFDWNWYSFQHCATAIHPPMPLHCYSLEGHMVTISNFLCCSMPSTETCVHDLMLDVVQSKHEWTCDTQND